MQSFNTWMDTLDRVLDSFIWKAITVFNAVGGAFLFWTILGSL